MAIKNFESWQEAMQFTNLLKRAGGEWLEARQEKDGNIVITCWSFPPILREVVNINSEYVIEGADIEEIARIVEEEEKRSKELRLAKGALAMVSRPGTLNLNDNGREIIFSAEIPHELLPLFDGAIREKRDVYYVTGYNLENVIEHVGSVPVPSLRTILASKALEILGITVWAHIGEELPISRNTKVRELEQRGIITVSDEEGGYWSYVTNYDIESLLLEIGVMALSVLQKVLLEFSSYTLFNAEEKEEGIFISVKRIDEEQWKWIKELESDGIITDVRESGGNTSFRVLKFLELVDRGQDLVNTRRAARRVELFFEELGAKVLSTSLLEGSSVIEGLTLEGTGRLEELGSKGCFELTRMASVTTKPISRAELIRITEGIRGRAEELEAAAYALGIFVCREPLDINSVNQGLDKGYDFRLQVDEFGKESLEYLKERGAVTLLYVSEVDVYVKISDFGSGYLYALAGHEVNKYQRRESDYWILSWIVGKNMLPSFGHLGNPSNPSEELKALEQRGIVAITRLVTDIVEASVVDRIIDPEDLEQVLADKLGMPVEELRAQRPGMGLHNQGKEGRAPH